MDVLNVFYFYFNFTLRTKIFSENVRKPVKKNKSPYMSLAHKILGKMLILAKVHLLIGLKTYCTINNGPHRPEDFYSMFRSIFYQERADLETLKI